MVWWPLNLTVFCIQLTFYESIKDTLASLRKGVLIGDDALADEKEDGDDESSESSEDTLLDQMKYELRKNNDFNEIL